MTAGLRRRCIPQQRGQRFAFRSSSTTLSKGTRIPGSLDVVRDDRYPYPMPIVVRRFLQWTALCSICAAPSFFWAYGHFHIGGMATGVMVFIGAYTLITSTERFERFARRPFVRRTLYIGYGIRVMCSITIPAGLAVDLIPGMISVGIVEWIARSHFGVPVGGQSPAVGTLFTATLAITLIQGTLLNLLLGLLMLVIYGVQRVFCTPPAPSGLCEKCGYDLRASYAFGRCPECGTPILVPFGGEAVTMTPSSSSRRAEPGSAARDRRGP